MNTLIKDGLVYLQSQQQTDGSFISLSSSDLSFKKSLEFHTVFSTALILQCLHMLPKNKVSLEIQAGCARFLLTQKSEQWSWNYWQRESSEAKKMPYPDDLDDTFCAAAALFQYNPNLITPTVLAKLVTLLTFQETAEGGPYRTWIVGEEAAPVWKDVDIAVNSNIAYFLFLLDVTLPRLNRFFTEKIEKTELRSPYYPSSYPITYFLSRFYKGRKKRMLRALLEEKQRKGYWDNPLNTALAVLSLLNVGVSAQKCKRSIAYLQEMYDGHWQPYPFYTGVNPSRTRAHVSGSGALTTAFCLTAISRYEDINKESVVVSIPKTKSLEEEETLYTDVDKTVKQRWIAFPTEIQDMALPLLQKIMKKEILLLPYYVQKSLQKGPMNRARVVQLGAANTYGWLAYTIYDRFLDEEAPIPALISVANIALRELTAMYERILPQNTHFHTLFHQVMDELETANTWEVTHCRLSLKKRVVTKAYSIPDYEDYHQLAQKSFGHALGPLALFFELGYTMKSAEIKQLMIFFECYLIARQLHDDAHDVVEDLQHGHISAVCAVLLKKYFNRKIIPAGTVLDDSLPQLQELFWRDIIGDVCQEIQTHIGAARKAIAKISIIDKPTLFDNLLSPLEEGARQALKQRNETVEFLETYTPDTN